MAGHVLKCFLHVLRRVLAWTVNLHDIRVFGVIHGHYIGGACLSDIGDGDLAA